MSDEDRVIWLKPDNTWANALKVKGTFQQLHDSIDRYFSAIKEANETRADLEDKQCAYARRETFEIVSLFDFDELVKATNDVFASQQVCVKAGETLMHARHVLFSFGIYDRWIKHNDLAIAIVEFDGLDVVAERWDAEFVLVQNVRDHPTSPEKWNSGPVQAFRPSQVGHHFVRSYEWARKSVSEPAAF